MMNQTSTHTKNEFLDNEFKKNLIKDQRAYIIKNSRPFLLLHKLLKWNFLERLIYDMARFHLSRTENSWEKSPYQPILDHIIEDINNILEGTNILPNPINIKHRDIRGFDIFNASASPWFGENILQVQSGLFWFSHILTRSLEPFIIKELKNKELKFPKNHFKNKFYNTIIAFITNDHTKSFSMFHYIFENASILTGLETFSIGHEYAHLLIANYSIDKLSLETFYSAEIYMKIISDEEIAADAVSLIILNILSQKKKDELIFYSPRLLFLVFSLLEKSKLITTPNDHPSNVVRYEYINDMMLQLGCKEEYSKMDEIISSIFKEGEQKIHINIQKVIKKKTKTENMFKEVQEKMMSRGFKELINFD